jgi:NAD(P)-dependent dehydrogenase (short-subunit alcohol dehydrogenase family)
MLAAGGGSIVITSSVKGLTGSTHRTAYSISKAGLDALTRMVATGYGKAGVRCNAIAPGIVATPALDAVPVLQKEALEDAHLTPSLGRPENIADAVVFLASDESAFITGQVVCVDGGLAAHTAALSPPASRVTPS